jgi:hypothetical protein
MKAFTIIISSSLTLFECESKEVDFALKKKKPLKIYKFYKFTTMRVNCRLVYLSKMWRATNKRKNAVIKKPKAMHRKPKFSQELEYIFTIWQFDITFNMIYDDT